MPDAAGFGSCARLGIATIDTAHKDSSMKFILMVVVSCSSSVVIVRDAFNAEMLRGRYEAVNAFLPIVHMFGYVSAEKVRPR